MNLVNVDTCQYVQGEADKTKSAKEEARELQLKEEAHIRQRVYNIKQKLSLGLKAIGEVVSGNPVMSHEELPYLVSIQFITNSCPNFGRGRESA